MKTRIKATKEPPHVSVKSLSALMIMRKKKKRKKERKQGLCCLQHPLFCVVFFILFRLRSSPVACQHLRPYTTAPLHWTAPPAAQRSPARPSKENPLPPCRAAPERPCSDGSSTMQRSIKHLHHLFESLNHSTERFRQKYQFLLSCNYIFATYLNVLLLPDVWELS